MLCSICKKNVAVVFTKNEKGENVELCLDCAKKIGIDPMRTMLEHFKNNTGLDINNITEQLNSYVENLDPEELDEIENMPFAALELFQSNENDLNANSNLDKSENKDKNNNQKIPKGFNIRIKNENKKKNKTRALDAFAINLTEKARKGELDKVIGRDKELERVIQILNRRIKNNPALLGEPGVR